MEPGEHAPIPKGSSEPHGRKAVRVRHEDYDTDKEFSWAIMAEVNDSCNIDLY